MKQKLTTRSSIALEKCEILAIHNYWMDFISSLTEWSCRASCRAELHDVWSRSKEKSTWKPIENKLKQMTRVTRRKKRGKVWSSTSLTKKSKTLENVLDRAQQSRPASNSHNNAMTGFLAAFFAKRRLALPIWHRARIAASFQRVLNKWRPSSEIEHQWSPSVSTIFCGLGQTASQSYRSCDQIRKGWRGRSGPCSNSDA